MKREAGSIANRLGAAIAWFPLLISACSANAATWPEQGLPVYDHIVIVIEENKNFDHVIGSPNAPFINQLAADGALLTRMFGEEHNSEGNYFWLFCGNRFDLGFEDQVPAHDLRAGNLAQQLIGHGLTFKGYSEDLPHIGSRVESWPARPCGSRCRYARKHVPWASFPDLCREETVDGCANLRFSDFESEFSKLPTVSMVVPNLIDDMHGVATMYDTGLEVRMGDAWLRKNLGAYYEWAKAHNSLLIVTFDENENASSVHGLTDPASAHPAVQNRIATVLAGARIRHGSYQEGRGVTHVNLLRTIEAMYGLGRSGAQQPHAVAAGIREDPIKDVFAIEKTQRQP